MRDFVLLGAFRKFECILLFFFSSEFCVGTPGPDLFSNENSRECGAPAKRIDDRN